MEEKAEELAAKIITLVEELASLVKGTGGKAKSKSKSGLQANAPKGATGGIRFLISEGYFDEPKQLAEVVSQLKREGRHYPKQTISMGLLNLVRERLLVRLEEEGSKNWKYVVRR